MKRMATLIAAVAALSLILAFSGISFAQGDAQKAPRGERVFKVLDPGNTGKITKEAFMAEAQKNAEKRWAKIDPAGKGSVTREEFMAARAMHKGGGHGKHGKPAEPAAPQQ